MSVSFKSQIAPKSLEFRPSEIIISDKYCAILTIVSYPKTISEGYLANITQLSGIKVCIKHIPIAFSVLSKMLNKEIADMKSKYQDEHDRTIQERLRQDYESIEQFISMLTATQARIFDFQMHLLISADSHEELENKKVQVKNYLDAMGMKGTILSLISKIVNNPYGFYFVVFVPFAILLVMELIDIIEERKEKSLSR